MKRLALILVSLSLLLAVPAAYAHDKDEEKNREGAHFELKTENHEQSGDEDENNEFKIRGQIESISAGSFVVDGQTIYIDFTQVNKFKQKGILDVGDRVKVKGIVKDGKNYAEDIKVIGEGQGRFMLKIKGLFTSLSPSPSPTPSPSPSASPEVSPTPTPSGSPSPTASASPSPSASPLGVTVKVKTEGPIELVTAFLQQVLAYLQGLLL